MNVTQIKSDIDFLCNSTSASYPDADKIRNMNIAYQVYARMIWDSSNGWQYDDSNMSTLPIAKTSLTNNQQDYTIPSTAQSLERVEILSRDGTWMPLRQVDIHDIQGVGMPSYLTGGGVPVQYDIVGRSVILYPYPNSAYCTLTSGMALYVSRDVTEFAVSAASATPGFATPFHRLLSYAAAIDYTKDVNNKNQLDVQKLRMERELVKFYSSRNVTRPNIIRPKTKRQWRQYL